MKDKLSKKLSEGVSMKEIETFTRKYLIEVFAVLAVGMALLSSVWRLFSGPSWSLFFASLGCVLALIFPRPVSRGLNQIYRFTTKQEQSTQVILGVVKVLIAFFLPFIYFGMMGLLAGSAYHYYAYRSGGEGQHLSHHPHTLHRHGSGGDEHD